MVMGVLVISSDLTFEDHISLIEQEKIRKYIVPKRVLQNKSPVIFLIQCPAVHEHSV